MGDYIYDISIRGDGCVFASKRHFLAGYGPKPDNKFSFSTMEGAEAGAKILLASFTAGKLRELAKIGCLLKLQRDISLLEDEIALVREKLSRLRSKMTRARNIADAISNSERQLADKPV